jgi:hypothetical protein
MTAEDSTQDEDSLRLRYLKTSKIFFLITLIYMLWIAIVILGTYSLGLGPKWAAFTIEQWVLSAIVLISVLLIFQVIFILHYLLSKRKKAYPEQRPQYLQGKLVHNYTLPAGARGGIFSKTYVVIDDERVLRLRYQMIPPQDLWGKQQ